jgi:beta-carotene ketolase (CrtO type)
MVVTMNDVIVVGAGINGLTCAAYLAKAGQRVLVLEANPHVGGFVITEDTPGAPAGYKINTYAIEFPFVDIKPSVVQELELARFGLRFTAPDPNNTYVGPEGTQFSNYHDLDRTCRSIAQLSKKDAEVWRHLMTSLMTLLDVGIPYLSDHPTRPSAATLAEIVRHAVRHRKRLLPAARILLQTPMEILQEFESEEVRAWIAMNVATGSFRPLDEIANTSILVYFAFNHKYPIRRPIGGAGAFTQALVDCIRSYGGEVRTSAPVDRILVSGGRATGVALQSGEEIRAKEVVGAIDPTSLFTKLIEPSAISASLRQEVDRMRVLSSNVSHFKADLAVSRRPTFPNHHITDDMLAGLTFVPSVDYVNRLMASIKRGELAEELPFYIAAPSVLDRSLVPAGSEGESLWVYIGAVPLQLADGTDWQQIKQGYFDRFVDLAEGYSPGFRDSILGAKISSPDDFNTRWAHKGSSRAVDLIPSQMGPWRPSPSLAGYDTPEIDGLWRSGHGTHPMSGTAGWPGRLTARTMLKSERRKRLVRRPEFRRS